MVLERLNTSIARMRIASLDGTRRSGRGSGRKERSRVKQTILKGIFRHDGEFIPADCRVAEICSKLERLNTYGYPPTGTFPCCAGRIEHDARRREVLSFAGSGE